ncbi:MAG TPA: glycosyltransferase family 9 protein [Acetobacteraceae bacterium]|nr:glycosyltransferase family 9 protein [Acetobacteraceae bacterium]
MSFQTKRRIDYWLGGFLLLLLFPLVRLLALALRRDHSLTRRRGCVVIKLVGAGSLFLAMPSMQAIREKFPPGCFFLVGMRGVASLAEPYGWFDSCWVIDDSSLIRLICSTTRVVWNVVRHTDHVIDLEVHSRLTTVLSLLTMVRNRIGFVDEIVFWRRGFYTHMTWFNTQGPAYAFYDLLAKWFDIQQIQVSRFHAGFRDRVQTTALPDGVASPARYMAIGHGCSDFAKERQLRPDEWARVLRPLSLVGYQFVLLGADADAALADQIIVALGCGQNLCGRLTLAQSARVIAGAAGFYGIDSLLLHVARALGIVTTSFWGPTDPATRLRPVEAVERVVFARMACAPCIHVNEAPPCRGRRECMAQAVNALTTGLATPDRPATTIAGWRLEQGVPAVQSVSITYA